MSCPLDYSLCDQTVTIYRMAQGQLIRQVTDGALLTVEYEQTPGVSGEEYTVHCHVILAGEDACLLPGDRIMQGIGPELSPAEWGQFLPVRVPGLAQLERVKPFYWQGRQCHVEGGG